MNRAALEYFLGEGVEPPGLTREDLEGFDALITGNPECGIDTYTDESFFSARREGTGCGRIINVEKEFRHNFFKNNGCVTFCEKVWDEEGEAFWRKIDNHFQRKFNL